MKPLVIPHSSYQSFVLDQLKIHYQGGVLTLTPRDWPLIAKCWITDLSAMTVTLRPHYDAKGPYPRDPASMFRSYLLFLLARPEIGITAWVDEMQRIPLRKDRLQIGSWTSPLNDDVVYASLQHHDLPAHRCMVCYSVEG